MKETVCIFMNSTMDSVNNKKSIKYKALNNFYLSILKNNLFDVEKAYNTKRTKCKICVMLSFYNKIFDWEYYISTYDRNLKKKFKNEIGALSHYELYGKKLNYKSRYNYSNFRGNIHNNNLDKLWIILDANPLARYRLNKYSENNEYLRVCINSPYHKNAKYLKSNEDRWSKLISNTGLEVSPWRKKGDHILIILNSCMICGYSMENVDIHKWTNDTIKKIRDTGCKRKIVLRLKCSGKVLHKDRNKIKIMHLDEDIEYFDPLGNLELANSKKNGLLKELENCWATVLYSTSACAISILKGIPVFSLSENSITYGYGNDNIENINNPELFDRSQLFEDLSNQLWSLEELKNGEVVNHLEKFYKNFLLK